MLLRLAAFAEASVAMARGPPGEVFGLRIPENTNGGRGGDQRGRRAACASFSSPLLVVHRHAKTLARHRPEGEGLEPVDARISGPERACWIARQRG